ncbi:MAG: peptidase C39 family protein [Anaerolineae bacterium]|nr:peptidase C39 family protein [Anaerolineae bacterium]
MLSDWLQIPHYRQSRLGACLPACARMILAYNGDLRSEAELAHLLGTYWYGTPSSRIVQLQKLGHAVSYEQTTLEQLKTYLKFGVPCILFIRTGVLPYWRQDVAHAVVLVGLMEDIMYVHDPALETGPVSVDRLALLLAWSELDYYCATIQ